MSVETAPDAVTTGAGRARRSRLVPVLVVLALLFAGLGIGFEVSHRSTPSNQALVDAAATSAVASQVTAALNTVLSYDYTKPAATQQAAESLLVGNASSQYALLFKALQSKAPGQQLTLVAKVLDTGVITLHGKNAQLLVFLDQSSTRASDNATNASAAQIVVTAVEQGGRWRISGLQPL